MDILKDYFTILRQSYDYHIVTEATLKNLDKLVKWIHITT